MLTCLREKSLKDDLETRKCKVENVNTIMPLSILATLVLLGVPKTRRIVPRQTAIAIDIHP